MVGFRLDRDVAARAGEADRRVERLEEIRVAGELDQAAREFVDSEIVPLWKTIRRTTTKGLTKMRRLLFLRC